MTHSLAYALEVAGLCFGVVMVAMTLLTAILYGIRHLAHLATEKDKGAAAALRADADVDPAVVVVITAAISAALDRPVLVHRVHLHHDVGRERWSRAGRMDILVSHQMRQNR